MKTPTNRKSLLDYLRANPRVECVEHPLSRMLGPVVVRLDVKNQIGFERQTLDKRQTFWLELPAQLISCRPDGFSIQQRKTVPGGTPLVVVYRYGEPGHSVAADTAADIAAALASPASPPGTNGIAPTESPQ